MAAGGHFQPLQASKMLLELYISLVEQYLGII